jgi:hypothetical protein
VSTHSDPQAEANALARERRQKRLLRAELTCERLPAEPILVRNCSTRGVGGATSGPELEPGERVTIRLLGQTVAGTVRWARGRNFGVSLDTRLTLDTVAEFFEPEARSRSAAGSDWQVSRLHQTPPARAPARLRRI